MKTLGYYFTLCLLIVSAQYVNAQYNLEQTLGAPYVQSIFPSEDGKSLAWIINEKGIRNIWFTEVNATAPRKVTAYDRDDGQDLGNITITSGFLIFTKGGGSNRYGDIANPASLPQVPKREILRLNLSNDSISKVDEAAVAVIAPDGKRMLVTKQSRVFLIEDISAPEIKSEVLFEVRRSAGSLSWSPDGNKIAFVSFRNDHSFVGVYSIEENKITWLAPSLFFDSDPAWSPDGSKIAFIRTPGAGRGELRNIMSGVQFEIVVANVNSGTGKTIWKSPGKDGGYSQYYPNAPLRWTKENKILFYSEHEGWNHIYSITPEGSGLKDLSPGECEVENSALSANHRYLYFDSNCTDINRRHIWKVTVATGQSQMVTDKSGIQSNVVTLEGEAIAYREGRHNIPTTALIQNGSTTTNLVSLPDNFPASQLVMPEAVQFKSADGLTIHGQLFLPSKLDKTAKLPAVIFMHGGPIRQMLLGYHYSGYYTNAYILNQYMASIGYSVLSVNYRNGIGYGRDFRLDENQGPRGASEYKDIIAAGKFLQSRPEINPEKIGLWGGSYGGYLTAMGLAKNSDLFKAGVDLHGVHDWAWRGEEFSPGGGWGITPELMELAYQSSPISEMQFWSSPVLIIHGDDDRNVMFGQSIDLQKKLDELGVHNEILVFPDEVHGFLRYESWLRANKATVDFFNRFLK
jgi:dipeptidyl aminopeptidase/acylaminoacyl peptidase